MAKRNAFMMNNFCRKTGNINVVLRVKVAKFNDKIEYVPVGHTF